jgi:hypothetical protein
VAVDFIHNLTRDALGVLVDGRSRALVKAVLKINGNWLI